MQSTESSIKSCSDYYIYSPSLTAKETFFYPLVVGYFQYESGYHLERLAYDSYLLMYLESGILKVTCDGETFTAQAGQTILINCYKPHQYTALTECTLRWVHFDGPMSAAYYNLITKHKTFTFVHTNPSPFLKQLHALYLTFKENQPVNEATVSLQITEILTMILHTQSAHLLAATDSSPIEKAAAYIHDHLHEAITLDDLAKLASLSPYYFTRLFKKETGYTPHQYILYARMNMAKFLLKNTSHTIKEICFECGFNCESNFCSSFKKWTDFTPSDYRAEATI